MFLRGARLDLCKPINPKTEQREKRLNINADPSIFPRFLLLSLFLVEYYEIEWRPWVRVHFINFMYLCLEFKLPKNSNPH